jgi:ABC-type transport system involved in multi-copper enzyme maturation permease subunit
MILLAAAALTLLGVFIEGLSSTLTKLAQEDQQRTLLGAGSAGVFFATLAGVTTVTSEFRYGTIHPTLLFEPRRRVVLLAKLAAAALVGVLFGVVCVGLSVGVGRAILAARDVNVALTGSDALALVFGTIAATVLGALLGVAVGTLIRNQVGSIVAVVVYAFVIDALLFAAVPSVGRYLPGKAGDGLSGQGVEHLLTPGVGAAVLGAWTLAFIAIASLRNARSDV